MANEIAVLSGDGRTSYDLLFLFPVASPAQVGTPPVNVVRTPSSGLPALAATVLTAAEKAALDLGTSAFLVVRMSKTAGMTNPELVADTQARYAAAKAEFDALYAASYLHVGARINAS